MSQNIGNTVLTAYLDGFNRFMAMMQDGTYLTGDFLQQINSDLESLGLYNVSMADLKINLAEKLYEPTRAR